MARAVVGAPMDESGRAMVIWAEHNIISANRFLPGQGWGEPVALMARENTRYVLQPRLVMTPEGVGVAAWLMRDGSDTTVTASVFDPESGQWGEPLPLSEPASPYNLAVSSGGNRVWVIWYQRGASGDYSVWLAGYLVEQGQWSDAVRLDTSGETVNGVSVAALADGTALVAWSQGSASLWGGRYDPDPGWPGPQQLNGTETTSVFDPTLAASGEKGAVLWRGYQAGKQIIVVRRYDEGKGWEPAGTVVSQSMPQHSRFPRLAVSGTGAVVAVWEASGPDDISLYQLYAARFDPQSEQWLAEERIDAGTGAASTVLYSQVGMDKGGAALVIWTQSFGTRYDVWGRHLGADGQWEAAMPIEDDGAGDTDPSLAVVSDGRALAAWAQNDGRTTHIWASFYTP